MYKIKENEDRSFELVYNKTKQDFSKDMVKNFFINELWEKFNDFDERVRDIRTLKSYQIKVLTPNNVKTSIAHIYRFIHLLKQREFHYQIVQNPYRKDYYYSLNRLKRLDKQLENDYLYGKDSEYYERLLGFYWKAARKAVEDSIDEDDHHNLNIIDQMTKAVRNHYNISKKDTRRYMYNQNKYRKR